MFPQSIKEARLLAGRGLLRAKRREILGVRSHCVFFGLFWRERNRIVFREGQGSIDVQRLKNFFVCNLSRWNILYLSGEAITLFGFLEWLASN